MTQVVAYKLGIDVSMIKIKPVTILLNPSGYTTGGSVGSEACCMAAIKCCDDMNQKLDPIKEQLGPGASWTEIITAADNADVDLVSRHM